MMGGVIPPTSLLIYSKVTLLFIGDTMLKPIRVGETNRGNVLYMLKPSGKEYKVKVRKVEIVGKSERLHYSTITKAGKITKTVKVAPISKFRRYEY